MKVCWEHVIVLDALQFFIALAFCKMLGFDRKVERPICMDKYIYFKVAVEMLMMKNYDEAEEHTIFFLKIAQSSSSSSSGTKMSCSSNSAAKFLLIRVPTYRNGTTTTVMRIRPNGVWKSLKKTVIDCEN